MIPIHPRDRLRPYLTDGIQLFDTTVAPDCVLTCASELKVSDVFRTLDLTIIPDYVRTVSIEQRGDTMVFEVARKGDRPIDLDFRVFLPCDEQVEVAQR